MSGITLKQLRYFEALAEHGHFGHAAAASAISQPALSVQIRDLEADLGVALFERGPRSVQLTGFGSEFAGRARAILQAVDELAELARAAQGPLTGKLRLGVIPTIAPYLLPELLKALASSHAALDVLVRETITPRLVAELQSGKLDVAIVALPISEAALVEVTLGEEAFVLVRSKSAHGATVPAPEDLLDQKLLLLEEGHCFRDQALAFCAVPGIRAEGSMEGSSLATLVQMVGAGLGVTLIPEMAVAVETRRAPVSVARFPAPEPQRKLGLVWRKTSPLDPQLREIAGLLRVILRHPSHA